jgi:uncharacterized OB-fold protein
LSGVAQEPVAGAAGGVSGEPVAGAGDEGVREPVAVPAGGIPPQPVPDADTAGFWEALAGGRLALCRCQACRSWMHPPLERCRRCGGPTSFEPVSGAGAVHSFIVMHRASVPGLGAVPHVIALVDLDDTPGVRLSGRIAGAGPGDVVVGARVTAHVMAVPGGPFYQPEFILADAGPPG